MDDRTSSSPGRSGEDPMPVSRSRRVRPVFALRRLLVAATVLLVVAALIVAVVVATLTVQVSGSSMRPTLRDGQRMLLDPLTRGGELARFDVVVFRPPDGSNREVKRIVAMPGDVVRVVHPVGGTPAVQVRRDAAGPWLRVVDPERNRDWGHYDTCCTRAGTASPHARAAVVPDRAYFVVGDNPGVSVDSREYGWVGEDRIDGRVWLVVWPLGDIAAVDDGPRLEKAG